MWLKIILISIYLCITFTFRAHSGIQVCFPTSTSSPATLFAVSKYMGKELCKSRRFCTSRRLKRITLPLPSPFNWWKLISFPCTNLVMDSERMFSCICKGSPEALICWSFKLVLMLVWILEYFEIHVGLLQWWLFRCLLKGREAFFFVLFLGMRASNSQLIRPLQVEE